MSANSIFARWLPGSLFVFVALLLSCAHPAVFAAEVTWTGAVDTDWSEAGNWSPNPPAPDDIAVIPLVTNLPEVETDAAVCAGIVLQEDATIRVLDSGLPTVPYALYVVGEGDIDGDGFSDVYERDYSEIFGDYDADGDGIPNFADEDSDDDTLSDACEYQFGPGEDDKLHPYISDDPDAHYDIDEFTNGEECAAGTNPLDPLDMPKKMPVVGSTALLVFLLTAAVIAFLVIRRAGSRARRVLSILLVGAIIPLGFYTATHVATAATLIVDFANSGQTIPQVAALASDGDTLEIDGASDRPWNGRSTYVTRPLTLRAVGGAVYLGGMRATFTLSVIGQGAADAQSVYTESDHDSPVSLLLEAGSAAVECFLGERLTLTADADLPWGFHSWTGDASDSSNPLAYQVVLADTAVTALFGPPGPDLTVQWPDMPMVNLFAGVENDFVLTFTNIGQSDTDSGPWDDGVYLSRDTLFDEKDYEMLVVSHSGIVDAGDTYDVTFTDAAIPDVAPGRYYILVVADAEENVDDANRSNNTDALSIAVLDTNLGQ